MAVTRIKNNQITDATVVASAKLVDYSITAAKIANNLTYGSDLTITGNLTVNGQTTTIDTVSTVIEDPIIVLASNQTGTPAVDIGFIGERGSSDNVAFVWDESADEFVTAFTTDLITNTTVTIASYSNFHTNDANVGGNLAVGGNISITGNVTSLNVTGNITGGNLLTPGLISATGNITGGNLSAGSGTIVTTGNINGGNLNATSGVTATTVTATGNVAGGNLTTAGQVVATGNVSGGNVTTAGITSTGSLTASTTIVATGNVTGGNVNTAGQVVATGNVNGGNLVTTGITSTGSLTASTTIVATGNITGGNLNTAGQVVATGNVNGGNVISTALVSGTTVTASGNVNGGNLVTSGITSTGSLTASTTIVATGNVTGGNLNTAGQVVATGNVNGGNLVTSGLTTTGTLAVSSTSTFTGNITSALNVTGNIAGGNLSTPGLISATGNITGGNLVTTGVTQTGTLTTTGNAIVGGNLIVQGNISYTNVDDLRVEDPVIILGTGPNGAPLTTDDGMDRGVFMEYYKSGLGNAFMGWDNSTGNMVIAASASFASNNIVNYNAFGTLQAGNLYIQSAVSTGNVTGGNLLTGGLVSATGNVTGGNLITSGLTSTGTLAVSSTSTFTGNITSALNVTGNIAGGNLNTAGQVVATGNITGGNLITSGSMTVTGNINGGNLNAVNRVSASTGYFTGNVDVLGNLNATIGVVYANSGIFYGNTTTGINAAFAGVPGFTPLGSNVIMQFAGNVPDYAQLNFQNISSSATASGDFVITSNNGTDTANFINMGMASSNWDGTQTNSLGNAVGANDGYLYVDGGDLVIGTSETGTNLKISIGAHNNTGNVAWFTSTGLGVTGVVTATGNVTGGNLVTAGLASITGNVTGGNLITAGLISAGTTITATGNVAGGNLTTAGQVVATGNVSGGNVIATALVTGANVTASANVTGANVVGTTSGKFGNIVISGDDITDTNGRVNFNTAGADVDFAINADTVANVFYVDAGTGTASFGSATQTTNAIVAFNATNSILMPVGNTAQRPSTGVLGMLRYNSIDDALETYTSGGWSTVGVPVFTVIADEQFNGDGATVAFTLGSSQTTASCIVSINGVVQLPTVAYSVSGTTLTFTEAPLSGDVIDVRQITTTTTVVAISNTGGNAVVAPNATAAQVDITGDLVPVANNVQSLGTASLRWSNLFVSGNTITMGNVVMKNEAGGNTIAFYGPDGTTPATIASSSVDTTQIASGTSAMAVVATNGNIRANVAGSTVALITSSGMQITGDLSVTGNATLSGNILGDRIQNGTTTIDIQTINGNANISIAGTSNVAVFSTAGANITGTLGVTGNITGGNLSGTSIVGTLTTAAQTNITSVGTLGSLTVTGNITGGNVNTAGKVTASTLQSNVATGTAPLTVSSTTIVTNLNADYLEGMHAVSTNTATSVVARDASGNFAAGTITATLSGAATTAGTVTTAAQPNITSVGTLSSLAVTGNITSGNLSGTSIVGTLTTASQTNITSVGTLGSLSVTGNITSGNTSGATLTASTAVSTPSIVHTGSNAVGNIGSSASYFNTVFAQATSALYADLAEKYVADAEYAPGTVVVFGGDKEITVSSTDADRAVAGVVSTNPSYIMNGGLEAEFVAIVALTGRVPCRVTGTVRKGDLMVSAGYGLARAEQDPKVGTVIGKALENFEGNEGVIEVVVGRF